MLLVFLKRSAEVIIRVAGKDSPPKKRPEISLTKRTTLLKFRLIGGRRMLKLVCPNCKKDDNWEVYEVLNDPRRNYRIHCFHCNERFVLPIPVKQSETVTSQDGLS